MFVSGSVLCGSAVFIQPLLSQLAYVVAGIVFGGMLNRSSLRCAGFFQYRRPSMA
jgi:hypothetical protein